MLNNNTLKEMGNRIRERREALNITQSELAEKTGYSSHSSIAKIENGVVDLPQSKILIIATALNTTPSFLFGDKPVLTVPEQYKDVYVAFENGDKDLTQDDIDDVIRFIEFKKSHK